MVLEDEVMFVLVPVVVMVVVVVVVVVPRVVAEEVDDDDWCFTATFVHMVDLMGRATSKGNEAKTKIKHPSDMPTPRFELG